MENKENKEIKESKESKDYEILNDKYLRVLAELENTKKRLEKDKIDSIRYANDRLLLEFMPILDNLEIAEKHIKEAKDFKAVQEGVDMIQMQIQLFLKDIGVEKIKTVGEKFDPHQHEAVDVEGPMGEEEGIITEELKPGYRINGRLLRPALVKIGKEVKNG